MLIMIGDSLTEWGNWEKLLDRKDIVNKGISGNTSYDILNRLDYIDISKKDTAILMLGINDIFMGYTVLSIFENYKTIINNIKENTNKIIIQSTVFAGIEENSMNKKVEELNALLKSYSKDSNVEYIDVNSTLAPDKVLKDTYTIDGVHFSNLGYQTWGNFLKKKLG